MSVFHAISLTIFLEDPTGLSLGEVDGLGGDLGGNDVARHQKVDFVFELYLGLFSADLEVRRKCQQAVPR